MNQTLQLSTDSINGVQLRVTFARETDRWSHVVERIQADQTTTVLSSIEGTADDDWPPSPPLQELSVHDLGNVQAILGVGMAGVGHWSISCTVDGPALKFELACLVKDKDQLTSLAKDQLGSRYQSSADCESGLELLALTEDVAKPTWATDLSQLQNEEQGEQIFRPQQLSTSGTVATRWAYQIRVA